MQLDSVLAYSYDECWMLHNFVFQNNLNTGLVSLRLFNDSVPTENVGKDSEGYGHNLLHGLFLTFGERAP